MAVGKAPVIDFKPLAEICPAENVEFSSPESSTFNQVAEASDNYEVTEINPNYAFRVKSEFENRL